MIVIIIVIVIIIYYYILLLLVSLVSYLLLLYYYTYCCYAVLGPDAKYFEVLGWHHTWRKAGMVQSLLGGSKNA